ncbi:hypothetical protein [Myxococcus eversor]|uniref:hypothetical protein n=1 Tax=Myxococcus eversor TaxID=2709661 RepID=UPI0013D43241|nr:hypothetical protein [Myxococcus eversor]
MDCPVLSFPRLVLFAAVALVCACEPISLSPIASDPADSGSGSDDGGDGTGGNDPDGGEELGAPDGGGPIPEDAGVDGGPRIPRPPLGDGGVDARMTEWNTCVWGWQSRTVLPLGNDRGYPQFALDADGEAYLVEYTGEVLRVVTTKPWRVFADMEVVGGQWWLGGIRVDASGDLHLALNPRFDDLVAVVPTDILHHSEGRWERVRLSSGWVRAFDLDASGRFHVLSLVDAEKHRINYVQGRIGDVTVVDTGLELGVIFTHLSMRVDARGKVHVTYEGGASAGRPVIYYATNASGTWVKEQVAAEGALPVIAVSPAGVPHILWASVGVVSLSTRSAEGEWSTTVLPFEGGGEMRISSSGVVHVLRNLGRQLEYRNNAQAGWVANTVVAREASSLNLPFHDWALEVDARGRAHVMYSELVEDGVRMLRRIGYSRQCP